MKPGRHSSNGAAPEGSAAIRGKLLVHVTFHFAPERIVYLRQALDAIGSYAFSRVDVVVDTNSDRSREAVRETVSDLDLGPQVEVVCRVHRDLHHPHVLTWTHRAHMREEIGRYDFFMYVEDDILVPWFAVVRWYHDTSLLYPKGLVRGFLRVEWNHKGLLVATDINKPERNPTIRTIDGRRYLRPSNPYQGLWLYTQAQTHEFLRSDSWVDPPCHWGLREKAAAGMIFSNVPESLSVKNQGRRSGPPSRLLIPLNDFGTPDDGCLVYHLPNNYALQNEGQKTGFGTVPVDKVIRSSFWRSMVRAVKRPSSRSS